MFNRKPKVTTGPIIIPDDRAQALAIQHASVKSEIVTRAASQRQETWFDRSVRPMLDELALRREQNGFGQEFTLSIMPKDRG